MALQLSITEENYLKAIYHLQQTNDKVSTNDLAASLHTKAASVTDMLKKLSQKKLVDYEPYMGFTLSEAGLGTALAIIRKHRLWEYFLVEHLQFGWDEVHAVAEELEHITSTLLVDRLDAFLGYPKFDPHGDPIPDINGKMVLLKQINLTDAPIQHTVTVSSVGSQSTALLEMLKTKNIGIGTPLKVLERFAFDHSMDVEINGNKHLNISQQLAQSLFVTI